MRTTVLVMGGPDFKDKAKIDAEMTMLYTFAVALGAEFNADSNARSIIIDDDAGPYAEHVRKWCQAQHVPYETKESIWYGKVNLEKSSLDVAVVFPGDAGTMAKVRRLLAKGVKVLMV